MTFGTLALVIAVGLLGPLLAMLPTRAAPPIVIGEIAAGVALGVTGTGTIRPSQPTLAFLADIGFALLMFIVGTNLPLRESRLRAALGRAVMATVVTFMVALALAPIVTHASGFHRFGAIAVLVAASSAAVVLPIVQNASESDALFVTTTWVTLANVVTLLAVPFVLATRSTARVAIGATTVAAAAVGVGLVTAHFRDSEVVRDFRKTSHRRGWALDLRLSLLVLFVLAWIAERFDLSVLVAGFAAGAVVAALGEPRRVAQQLIGLGEGFFVPLFFVVLGARLDLRALVHSGSDVWLLMLLVGAALAARVVAALVVRLPVGFALLACGEMGVPSAVASIGLTTHVLRPGQAAAIVGAAAVTLGIAAIGATLIGATAASARLDDDYDD